MPSRWPKPGCGSILKEEGLGASAHPKGALEAEAPSYISWSGRRFKGITPFL